ncbi:MAG: glycerate kinase type-2 family protein [Caldisericum sp.]
MIDEKKLSQNTYKEEFIKYRTVVLKALNRALESVDPYNSVKKFVKRIDDKIEIDGKSYNLKDFSRIYVIAFGKASIKMFKAISEIVKVDSGVVVSNAFSDFELSNVRFIKGGHPIPDEKSVEAGEEILRLARNTSESDLTFVLISGGGSALVESPLIELSRLQELTKLLMKKGADINELNAVRKHLSRIKGGKLLKSLKGTVISLIISDVIFDPLDVIASGPTYFDSSTFEDAVSILRKYNLNDEFDDVVRIFEEGLRGNIEETLKPGEKLLCAFENHIIASNYIANKALLEFLKESGINTFYLGPGIHGIASSVAKAIAGIGRSIDLGYIDIRKPTAIVFGGETTVEVKGNGIGGRNSELTLYIAKHLERTNFVFASIGTDGIDGVSPAAGAIADSQTLEKAKRLNLDINMYLENNDSFTFFDKLGDAIITGPTGTNVADISVLLIF